MIENMYAMETTLVHHSCEGPVPRTAGPHGARIAGGSKRKLQDFCRWVAQLSHGNGRIWKVEELTSKCRIFNCPPVGDSFVAVQDGSNDVPRNHNRAHGAGITFHDRIVRVVTQL